MARVLVIGATGHLGAAVAHAFADAGWEVAGWSRGSAPSANLERPGAPAAALPWLRGVDPAEACRGFDVVVDAAAPYPVDPFVRGAPDPRHVVQQAVARTEAWLAGCRRHGARFIGIGSFVAHRLRDADSAPTLRRRISPWLRGRHPYFAVKVALDALLRSAATTQPVVALNPTGCLGPYDLKEPRLALVPRLDAGTIPVAVPDVVDFIDARDVGLAAVRVATGTPLAASVLLAGHSLPFSAFIDRLCAGLGRPPPALRAPAITGVPALIAAERVLGAFGRGSPVPTLTVSIVLECGAVERSAEQRALGLRPRPLEETIADTVAWYRGPVYRSRWPETIRMGRSD